MCYRKVRTYLKGRPEWSCIVAYSKIASKPKHMKPQRGHHRKNKCCKFARHNRETGNRNILIKLICGISRAMTFVSIPCVCAKSLQYCLTLWDPMDYSPPGSSVHGVLQARILEWVATPSSRASSRPRDRIRISYVSCTGRWVLYHWATWEGIASFWKCRSSPDDQLVASSTAWASCERQTQMQPRAVYKIWAKISGVFSQSRTPVHWHKWRHNLKACVSARIYRDCKKDICRD